MATICLHIGRLEEARIAHEQALRSNPRTRTGNLEYFYIYSGDFARAEEAAEAWFRERPGNIYALVTRIASPAVERTTWSSPSNGWRRRCNTRTGRAHDRDLSRHAARPARSQPTSRCSVCVARWIRPRSFGHTHHTTTTSPACTRCWETRTRRWRGSNAAATPGSRAGRSSESIPISRACARSPPSNDSSLTSSRNTPL